MNGTGVPEADGLVPLERTGMEPVEDGFGAGAIGDVAIPTTEEAAAVPGTVIVE